MYTLYICAYQSIERMMFASGPSQRLLNIDGIKILYIIDEGLFHLYYTHTHTSRRKRAEAGLAVN